jgi:hypothetical protein
MFIPLPSMFPNSSGNMADYVSSHSKVKRFNYPALFRHRNFEALWQVLQKRNQLEEITGKGVKKNLACVCIIARPVVNPRITSEYALNGMTEVFLSFCYISNLCYDHFVHYTPLVPALLDGQGFFLTLFVCSYTHFRGSVS